MKTGKGPIALSDEARDRVSEQLHARYVATIVGRLREVGTLDLAAADLPIRVVDRPIDDFRTDPSLDLARYVRDVLVDRATYLDERSFRLDFTESDFNLDDYILHGDAAEDDRPIVRLAGLSAREQTLTYSVILFWLCLNLYFQLLACYVAVGRERKTDYTMQALTMQGSLKGEKEAFIEKWKDLEVLCDSIFHPITGTPMDEVFTRYMYYERAKQGTKSSTTEALRKFYEKNNYALLKNDQTFENLIDLANFWNDVQNQSVDRFSNRVLRRLFVLNYAPNGMWTYFVSVYYMSNRDDQGLLDDDSFYQFLNKITAFIWAYAVTNPGVNALRTPIFAEMVNIVNRQPVTFREFLFNTQQVQNAFQNYSFSNNRAITKSMLTWWAFQDQDQILLPLESVLEIEHIYARNRQEKEHSLSNPKNIEALGNKVLLEKRINIRASDYRFADKVKYYVGFENARKQRKEGTKIKELTDLAASVTDFAEADIVQRNAQIIFSFVEYMHSNGLLSMD